MVGDSWLRTTLNHVNKEQMLEILWAKYSGDGYDTSLKSRYGNFRFFQNENEITERITKGLPLAAATIGPNGESYIFFKKNSDLFGVMKLTFGGLDNPDDDYVVGGVYYSRVYFQLENETTFATKDRSHLIKQATRCFIILPLQFLEGSQTVCESSGHLDGEARELLSVLPEREEPLEHGILSLFIDIDHFEFNNRYWDRPRIWQPESDEQQFA
jgi:hypothetical protein